QASSRRPPPGRAARRLAGRGLVSPRGRPRAPASPLFLRAPGAGCSGPGTLPESASPSGVPSTELPLRGGRRQWLGPRRSCGPQAGSRASRPGPCRWRPARGLACSGAGAPRARMRRWPRTRAGRAASSRSPWGAARRFG
ncbi:unnamed protein product, partial [Prorocentrum cordatum]